MQGPIVVSVDGLNIYNPTDEQLLLLIKADMVLWRGRGGGKLYKIQSISAPVGYPEGDGLVYHINVGHEVEGIANRNMVKFERSQSLVTLTIPT